MELKDGPFKSRDVPLNGIKNLYANKPFETLGRWRHIMDPYGLFLPSSWFIEC